MKPLIKAAIGVGLSCLIATPDLLGQDAPAPKRGFGLGALPNLLGRGSRKTAEGPVNPNAPAANAVPKTDAKVYPASSVPELTRDDQLQPATITVPDDPIEPWLLTKEVGPFLVLARTFRGPEAEGYALALAKELRTQFGLPAFILRTKDFPGKSNIRNVPPTARPELNRPIVNDPERVRTHDEAAVLVGDEKTEADSLKLLYKVQKIQPKCLEQVPTPFGWRKGLSTATRTTNPFVPTQNIYPGRKTKDNLVLQMNSGPRSIYNCPGRFTIQVAEFGGRSTFNKDERLFDRGWLEKSPLRTAADDAEKVATALASDPEVKRTGYQPYVYHDRTTSKVMIGSFNNPSDPSAVALHEVLMRRAVPIMSEHRGMFIAPANALTDLEDPNQPIKNPE